MWIYWNVIINIFLNIVTNSFIFLAYKTMLNNSYNKYSFLILNFHEIKLLAIQYTAYYSTSVLNFNNIIAPKLLVLLNSVQKEYIYPEKALIFQRPSTFLLS